MGIYALTGGATGIGAAIKKRLIENNHIVISVDLKNADIDADLSTKSGRDLAIEKIRNAAPEGLDGLITCAGLGSHVPNPQLIASVNYYGTVELVRGVSDLVSSKQGRIILISSNSAPMCQAPDFVDALLETSEAASLQQLDSLNGMDAYSGSKQAVARWMRRHTAEYAKQGMTINAVAPGYTQTPMTEAVANDATYGEAIKQFVASIPVGRPGLPEDMADAVEFLLSDKARFICGSVLFVDGGHDAMLRPDKF
jgi:NAD(P)-dependent dehydrogenase (short-subunit alcohol dehydrogenase family)